MPMMKELCVGDRVKLLAKAGHIFRGHTGTIVRGYGPGPVYNMAYVQLDRWPKGPWGESKYGNNQLVTNIHECSVISRKKK